MEEIKKLISFLAIFFISKMEPVLAKKVIDILSKELTKKRFEKMKNVLENRISNFSICLENSGLQFFSSFKIMFLFLYFKLMTKIPAPC